MTDIVWFRHNSYTPSQADFSAMRLLGLLRPASDVTREKRPGEWIPLDTDDQSPRRQMVAEILGVTRV